MNRLLHQVFKTRILTCIFSIPRMARFSYNAEDCELVVDNENCTQAIYKRGTKEPCPSVHGAVGR